MNAPSTSIEWTRWTRDVMPRLRAQRAISRGEGLMLKELGSRADRNGGCFASAATLGKGIDVCERQAERLLAGLREKRLIKVQPRGRGCIRILQPEALPDLLDGQLSFDDLLAADLPAPVQQVLPADPAPAKPAAPPTSMPRHPTSGCRTKDMKLSAAADTRVEEEAERFTADVIAVDSEHLGAVVALLRSAPDVGLVDPYVVNTVLVSRPESAGYRHVEAAGDVASAVRAGRFGHKDACRLLGRVLDDQLQAGRQRHSRPPASHSGRRRAAPPVSPAMVELAERQTATMWRLAAAAGFGAGQR